MNSERISPFWVNGYQPFSANAGQTIVFHTASEDIDVCGAVVTYNRKIFDEGF